MYPMYQRRNRIPANGGKVDHQQEASGTSIDLVINSSAQKRSIDNQYQSSALLLRLAPVVKGFCGALHTLLYTFFMYLPPS